MVPRGLQWGRRFSTAETGTPPTQAADEDPFNGAAVSQRRKPSARCATRARSKPFNGAAVSQRRKLRSAAHRGRAAPPSMGPPFLNGGNRNCRVANGSPISTFNGAAVSQRRKPKLSSSQRLAYYHLQWGRRFSTAETGSVVGRGTGSTAPSMGPPFLNGGNTLGLSADSGAPNHLQWGRRFSTAETGRTASDRS